MSEIKKAYEGLKKKHSLPGFEELDNEFEISALEKEDFLLRETRRKIEEKLELFIKLLTVVIQPEANIAELRECRGFSNAEKEQAVELYKKVMKMHNSALLAGINCNDKDDASFISETFKEWPQIKKQMLWLVGKMKSAWENDIDIKEELGYLG